MTIFPILAGGFLTGKYKRQERVPNDSRGFGNDRMKAYMNDKGFAIIELLQEISHARQSTIPQTALAWLLANPTITSVIVGANRVSQLADSLAAADMPLSADQKTDLDGLPSPS